MLARFSSTNALCYLVLLLLSPLATAVVLFYAFFLDAALSGRAHKHTNKARKIAIRIEFCRYTCEQIIAHKYNAYIDVRACVYVCACINALKIYLVNLFINFILIV